MTPPDDRDEEIERSFDEIGLDEETKKQLLARVAPFREQLQRDIDELVRKQGGRGTVTS